MASRRGVGVDSGADSSKLIGKFLYVSRYFLLGLITIGCSCTHALVEFVEEECTGVVPLQRINGKGFEG